MVLDLFISFGLHPTRIRRSCSTVPAGGPARTYIRRYQPTDPIYHHDATHVTDDAERCPARDLLLPCVTRATKARRQSAEVVVGLLICRLGLSPRIRFQAP